MKSYGRGKRNIQEEIDNIEIMKNHVSVDIDKGIIYWTKPLSNRAKSGDIAGSPTPAGYHKIAFNGVQHLRHRVIFYLAKGYLPPIVDHVHGKENGDGIDNLQEITAQYNQSKKMMQTNNTSGYRGVSWNKRLNKWGCSIEVCQKKIHLGYFSDVREAAKAYNDAAIQHFGKFAVLNEIPVDLSGE
jgi:hypothetical protein